MSFSIRFYPKDVKKNETLLMLYFRWENTTVKVSTKQRIYTETWDADLQLCITSKEKFNIRINNQSKAVNESLKSITAAVMQYVDNTDISGLSTSLIKKGIIDVIENLFTQKKNEIAKKKITASEFFASYIERKRIDFHTGRYINERTKVHHRTVLKRIKSFLAYTNLLDTFSTFTSKSFDSRYTDWCYSVKKYKQNTVYATYGVLKPWLNAAKEEGFDIEDSYKHLKGKCVDVDAIYLTEDEIKRIYLLDIPKLIELGEIDSKSTIEQTRDLFIISCWTGLRRSDINQLNKACFNIEKKTIMITAEKTKRPIVIPMHPMVVAIWKKYEGKFPHLVDKGNTCRHLRECARHAKIEDEVRIVENRGGVVKTLSYKKYQLVGMHTGRRSFATNMYKRRFPIIAIMRLTGHTTENNFLKYIKVTPEENAAMMADEFIKCQNPFGEVEQRV